jgi:hypothetical protein
MNEIQYPLGLQTEFYQKNNKLVVKNLYLKEYHCFSSDENTVSLGFAEHLDGAYSLVIRSKFDKPVNYRVVKFDQHDATQGLFDAS